MYKLVEKDNHLIVHGIFSSRMAAQFVLDTVVPQYVEQGFYVDKTLTPDSFEIIRKEG